MTLVLKDSMSSPGFTFVMERQPRASIGKDSKFYFKTDKLKDELDSFIDELITLRSNL